MSNKNFIVEKNLIKFGDSLAIIIPKWICKLNNLCKGQPVVVEVKGK